MTFNVPDAGESRRKASTIWRPERQMEAQHPLCAFIKFLSQPPRCWKASLCMENAVSASSFMAIVSGWYLPSLDSIRFPIKRTAAHPSALQPCDYEVLFLPLTKTHHSFAIAQRPGKQNPRDASIEFQLWRHRIRTGGILTKLCVFTENGWLDASRDPLQKGSGEPEGDVLLLFEDKTTTLFKYKWCPT